MEHPDTPETNSNPYETMTFRELKSKLEEQGYKVTGKESSSPAISKRQSILILTRLKEKPNRVHIA
jgi:hypothetical protein